MNQVNTSPQSNISYQKTNRPYITPDNGSAAAMEGYFSVPAESSRSFDTNRSKIVAPGAVPHQQNVVPNKFPSTTLGREHFYNAVDPGKNPENLVEQQSNYTTTQLTLNGYYAYPGENQNYQSHNQHQPFFRNNHRSVKLPNIRVKK